MAMRYVYHLTKDGGLFGPGSMFVFASCLLLVAAGCAFALPKDKADSRQSRRHSSSNFDYDDTETEAESTPFVDATTPMIMRESTRDSESSSGSYGTDNTQTGTEIP